MLLASGPHATRSLFVAAAYFRSLVDADSMDLVGRYVSLHGAAAPPLNNAAESCYEGIQTLANLIHRAGNPSTAALDPSSTAQHTTAHGGPLSSETE